MVPSFVLQNVVYKSWRIPEEGLHPVSPLPEGKMLLIKTVGEPDRRMRMLAREVHQEQMAQDRSGLSSSLAVLGVKRVMQVGTAVSGMATQGSRCGGEGEVL